MKEKINKNKFISKSADYGDYEEIYLTIQPNLVNLENHNSQSKKQTFENNLEKNNSTQNFQNEFQAQSINCLRQLQDFFLQNEMGFGNVLNFVVLMQVKNDEDYLEKANFFELELKKIFNLKQKPIVGFTAQTPYQSQLVLEITLISLKNETTYIQKEIELEFNEKKYQVGYGVIETENTKELSIEGIGVNENFKDTFYQSDGAYFLLNEILKAENMTIKNIVCQRNHIDKIVEIIEKDGKELQRYQIYNEKRGENYGQKRWECGYPSATGIGASAGGVNIFSIRVKAVKNLAKKESLKIVPIDNPMETSAFKYSKKVLEGSIKKTSPQFERGKAVVYENGAVKVYISGTASVRGKKREESGELTFGVGDVVLQTEITLENIEILISKENLQKHGINVKKEVNLNDLVMAKVYVKNESDFEKVIEFCKKKFPKNLPVNYVVADVCRPDWLVEIEGIAKTDIF